MSTVNQQLEQIAESLKDSDGKLSQIVNGGTTTVVQTGSGPQPSYAKWRNDKEADFEEAATRAETAATAAEADADRANVYADNTGYVTRERLRKKATLDLDFSEGRYSLDDGERLDTNNANDILTVERATPTWALSANGKYREVPINKIARDWNPETGQYESQVSGAVTNELKMSTSFSTPQWGRNGVTADVNPAVLIEGFLTTNVEATSSSFPRLQQSGIPFTQGNRKTISIRFREKTTSLLHGTIELPGTATLRVYADTDQKLSSAAVNIGDWGAVETKLEKDAQGFHIFSTTFTVPADGSYNVFFGPSSVWQSGNSVELGASITFAHAQLVEGTTPGPVIVTEDEPVTRAADEINRVLGVEFNRSAGTFIFDVNLGYQNTVGGKRIFELSDGASSNTISAFFRGSGGTGVTAFLGGASVIDLTPSGAVSDGVARIGVTFNSDTLTASVNGATSVSSQSSDVSSILELLTKLNLGSTTAGSLHLDGGVSLSAYMPVETTAAELQELT